MSELKIHIDPEPRVYTGRQLRSRYAADTFGIEGDSIVAWSGPCDVPTENLVDLDDVRDGAIIKSGSMVHFIAEHPGIDLETAVCRQRLLVALGADVIRSASDAEGLKRIGDDLYIEDRKLTVSIATTSPHSALIHLGVNIDPAGAPVPAIGLKELHIEPSFFTLELLHAYQAELAGIAHACTKVRPVL